MIKCSRTHFDKSERELGLEGTLNQLVDDGNKILFVTSDYYGYGEVAYTIIYDTQNYD